MGQVGSLDAPVTVTDSCLGTTTNATIVPPYSDSGGHWISPIGDSQWDSVNAGSHGCNATYQATFTVPADAISPSLSVTELADNSTNVSLNGNQPFITGNVPGQCVRAYDGPPVSGTTTSGLVPGVNTLTFNVDNCYPALGQNPTGLDFVATVTYAGGGAGGGGGSGSAGGTGAPAHYRVELADWIPFAQIVDPEQPFAGAYLGFPPWGGVSDTCYSPPFVAQFGTTVLSTYHGDAHTDYDVIDGSYRVLAVAEFDWDGRQITNFQGPSALGYRIYGQTQRLLDYFGPDGHHRCVADRATATHGVLGAQTSSTTFDLEIHSSNPLVHPSPDIDTVLTGLINADGDLDLQATPDEFPSQGVRVSRDARLLATAILNDASCLRASSLLGVGGAYTVFAGLTHAAPALILHVPASPAGGSPLRFYPQPTPLCDPTDRSVTASAMFVTGVRNAATASRTDRGASPGRVLVAASADGQAANGRFMTLGMAEQRGLVVSLSEPEGVLVSGTSAKPFVVSMSGGSRLLGILKPTDARRPAIMRYRLPGGETIVAPFAPGGLQVRWHGRPVRRLRAAAPRTTVRIVRMNRHRLVLRFHVHSRMGFARTYVQVGKSRIRLARHGVFVLRGRQSVRLSYFSVDGLGDVERPRRLR